MKMYGKTLVAAVVGSAVSTMFYSGVANAVTDSVNVKGAAQEVYDELSRATDPEQAYDKLTARDQEIFDAYFLPAEVEETVTLTQINTAGVPTSAPWTFPAEADAVKAVAASSTCWVGTSKYTMKAALGNAIWDTWTEGKWCGNGSSVTSASFSRSWATIAAVGWRDAGQIGSGSGITGNQARIWSQRKMILGVNGWDVQTQQPCNRLNGSAKGSASQTWSCSIA